jgi:dihydrofolate reductase
MKIRMERIRINQRKVVLYIAASLDGYIATKEHTLDWLFAVEGEGDNGYSAFYDTVDTILLGRTTYDWIMEHESGNFPYPNKECFVFTNTPREENEHVTFISEDIAAFTNRLKQRAGGTIWLVGGGKLLDAFLKARLVEELIVTIAPVVIGQGIPLFKENDAEFAVKLVGIQRFGQFAELHYEVKGPATLEAPEQPH